MPSFSLVFLIAVLTNLVLSFVLSSWRHKRTERKLGCEPAPLCPHKDPLGISNILEILQAEQEKRVPDIFEHRVQRTSNREKRSVSTFRVRQLGQESIFTCDPTNIKTILATKFEDFDLGEARVKGFRPLLGTGIFTSSGIAWKGARSMLRPQFSRRQLSHLDIVETHVQKAMRALPVGSDGWTAEVNLSKVFFNLTMDTATEFLLGESAESQTGSLGAGKSVPNDFSVQFDKAQWYIARRAGFGLHWILDGQDFRRSCRQVHNFLDHYVELALHDVSGATTADQDSSDKYVFLNALVHVTQDSAELRSHIANVLLAGRDTTACLLSWTIILLGRHPEIFKKLRQAIIAEFGTYEHTDTIHFTSLKACHYLQWCLKEVLRLFPPVPFNYRCAVKDTTLPMGGGEHGTSPVYIRKGQAVMYHPHVLHRAEEIWGANASDFIPERWSTLRTRWEYIPFNGGRRICVGQQFALTEAAYVLVRFIQRFDELDVLTNPTNRYNLTLTSSPADPLVVRLHQDA
ncbi:hypothetical protein FE257_008032 [Aspergillus nanangensis]|uniref:Cytochrome P450 n=1 Tax=Aspergillus nanangensis TaxID=2582783 RepID=A0AAD4CM48_ASPNN|nr:hypothetical protein FE257_008032 [Aspergillus nanangensis]